MLAAGTAATLAVLAAGEAAVAWVWLLVPAAWLGAALAPRLWRADAWGRLRLWPCGPARAVFHALWVSAALGALAFLGVAVLARLGFEPPLGPAAPPDSWIVWAVHQWLYVALSEEVFFRGYFQGEAEGLLLRAKRGAGTARWGAAVLAAAAFALAHAFVFGVLGAMVFFPALAFGWLRVRTGGVGAPVLAHGAANVVYAAICLAF